MKYVGEGPTCVASITAQAVEVMCEGHWFNAGIQWSKSICTGLFICVLFSNTNENVESLFYAFFLNLRFFKDKQNNSFVFNQINPVL